MLQGRVDLKFRIVGTQGKSVFCVHMSEDLRFLPSEMAADSVGAGTVYFTSIRPQQESTWRIGESYYDDCPYIIVCAALSKRRLTRVRGSH